MQAQAGASLSYLTQWEAKVVREILTGVALLPELQQESHLKLLAQPPFHNKLPQLRHLLKSLAIPPQPTESDLPTPPADFPMPGIVPPGWQVDATGLYRQTTTRLPDSQLVKVAEAPLVITEQYHDIDTTQYYLKAGFYQRNHWQYRTESREIFMSSRLLPGLAKWGFPTTTENAKQLVAFLSEYEAANREQIQVRQVVSSCGNKTINGQSAFVLGRRCIYPDKEETIEFLAPDAGDVQIVHRSYMQSASSRCQSA